MADFGLSRMLVRRVPLEIVYQLWKKGQTTWEEYKDFARIYKEKIRRKLSKNLIWPLPGEW